MSATLLAAKALLEQLQKAGHRGFVVGGFVRDRLMGRPTGDLDIASPARPDQIEALFPRVHATGLSHGTVTIMVDDLPVEHTTFRAEGHYSDHRHPDTIRFVSTIEEDLARRDFTVNAIAWDPLEDCLIDPFNGAADLEARKLRAVGVAEERLREDALRILRAVRFASTHDLVLVDSLAAALRAMGPLLRNIAVERIEDELDKLLARSERPSIGFRLLAELQLLDVILPEFVPMMGQAQNRHHAYDVWNHTLAVLDACPSQPTALRWAALFHDLGKPVTAEPHPDNEGEFRFFGHEQVSMDLTEQIGQRLKFSKARQRRVGQVVAHHMIHPSEAWGDSAIRRLLRKLPGEDLDDFLAFKRADLTGKGTDDVDDLLKKVDVIEARLRNQRAAGHALSRRDLRMSSQALMDLAGRPGGPWLSALQNHLLEAVLEQPDCNEPERLRVLAIDWLQNHPIS